MARAKMSDAQRTAVEELLADAKELRDQNSEAEEAGLGSVEAVKILDERIARMEAALRIF